MRQAAGMRQRRCTGIQLESSSGNKRSTAGFSSSKESQIRCSGAVV